MRSSRMPYRVFASVDKSLKRMSRNKILGYNSRIYGHQTTGKEYLMAKTADTIAIYSRKSRYTGKGESIGNQIALCREYIRTHHGDAATSAIFPA